MSEDQQDPAVGFNPVLVRPVETCYLSHHVLPIDEGFESAHGSRITQREDVLGLDGDGAQVGVFLENDYLTENKTHVQL